MLALGLLLLCLPGRSQYNFTEVDSLLSGNQKALGNDLVAMIYKDGKIVYQKQMGEFTVKTKVPIASCTYNLV